MLFLSFLLILLLFYSNASPIIILKGQGRLSADTMQLLQGQTSFLGLLTPKEMAYNLTDTDIDTPFKIDVSDMNGDIGVGQEEYLNSIKNYKVQGNTSVFITYDIHPSVISSTNYSSYAKSAARSNVNCTYSIREAAFNSTEPVSMRTDFTKYLYYSHFILSLDANTLHQVISNRSFLLSQSELQSSLLEKEKVEDFWIFKTPIDNDDNFIVLTPTKVLIYNIVILNGIFFIDFQKSISRDILSKSSKINSVGLFGETILFTTSTGLLMLQPDNSVSQFYPEMLFTDIIVLSSSIYLNAPMKGVYIISMSNTSDRRIIHHSSIKQIDLIQNPFTGNTFLGILLNTIGLTDDFYIEYYIPHLDELNPIVNKVFCYESHQIKSYVTPDSFYSYFLDYNNVYVIRRGMLNKIPSMTLSLRFHSIYNITSIDKYYDQSTNKILPAIVAVNQVYPFQFTEPKHKIQCTVKQPGKYILIFRRITDACESNIGYSLKVCSKMNFYSFKVFGSELTVGKKVTIIVVTTVSLCIAVGLLIYCCYYNNRFRTNRLRIIQMDKKDRTNLYKETDIHLEFNQETTEKAVNTVDGKEEDLNKKGIGTEPVVTVGRFVSSRIPTAIAMDSENRNEQTNVQNLKINSNQNLISIYHHVASKNVTQSDKR